MTSQPERNPLDEIGTAVEKHGLNVFNVIFSIVGIAGLVTAAIWVGVRLFGDPCRDGWHMDASTAQCALDEPLKTPVYVPLTNQCPDGYKFIDVREDIFGSMKKYCVDKHSPF